MQTPQQFQFQPHFLTITFLFAAVWAETLEKI